MWGEPCTPPCVSPSDRKRGPWDQGGGLGRPRGQASPSGRAPRPQGAGRHPEPTRQTRRPDVRERQGDCGRAADGGGFPACFLTLRRPRRRASRGGSGRPRRPPPADPGPAGALAAARSATATWRPNGAAAAPAREGPAGRGRGGPRTPGLPLGLERRAGPEERDRRLGSEKRRVAKPPSARQEARGSRQRARPACRRDPHSSSARLRRPRKRTPRGRRSGAVFQEARRRALRGAWGCGAA